MNENAPIITLGRPGNEIAIHVYAREFPNDEDFWDGNWVRARLVVTNGGINADLQAFLRAEELSDFADQVSALDGSLSGEATFETMENWLRLRIIRSADGQLEVIGTVRDADRFGSSLDFALTDLDRTQLASLRAALTELVERFPVVGRP